MLLSLLRQLIRLPKYILLLYITQSLSLHSLWLAKWIKTLDWTFITLLINWWFHSLRPLWCHLKRILSREARRIEWLLNVLIDTLMNHRLIYRYTNLRNSIRVKFKSCVTFWREWMLWTELIACMLLTLFKNLFF